MIDSAFFDPRSKLTNNDRRTKNSPIKCLNHYLCVLSYFISLSTFFYNSGSTFCYAYALLFFVLSSSLAEASFVSVDYFLMAAELPGTITLTLVTALSDASLLLMFSFLPLKEALSLSRGLRCSSLFYSSFLSRSS